MSGEARSEGHCLCGAVTIALDNPAQHIEICQCDMCRRWAGSFYSAQTGENPRVSGEEAVTAYQSSEWAERAFCSSCGSGLWYLLKPTGGRTFLTGLFADLPTGLPIKQQIFIDENPTGTTSRRTARRKPAPKSSPKPKRQA